MQCEEDEHGWELRVPRTVGAVSAAANAEGGK